MQADGVDREVLSALGIVGKHLAQVNVAQVRVVLLQGPPGRALVGSRHWACNPMVMLAAVQSVLAGLFCAANLRPKGGE
jgi:hypothetical protein